MRAIFMICLALLLTACAQQSNVRLYPGNEQSSSQLLTLVIPQDLEVTFINGQRFTASNNLIGSQQHIELLPGDYEVVVMFKRVFDIGGGISHEVIRSRQAIVALSGAAGETWQLEYTAPDSLEQARQLRDVFSVSAVSQQTGKRVDSRQGSRPASPLAQLIGVESTVAEADHVVLPLQATQTAAAQPRSVQQPAQAVSTATLPANDATLTTLQQLWLLLSPESRQQFLDWVQ